jgi:hypothetical protein
MTASMSAMNAGGDPLRCPAGRRFVGVLVVRAGRAGRRCWRMNTSKGDVR